MIWRSVLFLEPKLFRELTRKPTGSFSFLACPLLLLYIISYKFQTYETVKKMYTDKSILLLLLLLLLFI